MSIVRRREDLDVEDFFLDTAMKFYNHPWDQYVGNCQKRLVGWWFKDCAPEGCALFGLARLQVASHDYSELQASHTALERIIDIYQLQARLSGPTLDDNTANLLGRSLVGLST